MKYAGCSYVAALTLLSLTLAVFEINQNGEIITTQEIDREEVTVYTLLIQVRDSSVNPSDAITNVTVTINDVNDNTPEFVGGAVLSGTAVEISEVGH